MLHHRMREPSNPAAGLIARFRRQRPLRAGSLIVTIFGDSIAPRGGAITLGSLIPLLGPFGVTERLVRTSVGRLAQDGWLTAERAGRLSEYHLADEGRQRFADATRRIYAGPRSDWSGQWTLVRLAGVDGGRRRAVRDALRWEGFGELEPGWLVHPTLTPGEARTLLESAGLGDQALILASRAPESATDARLVADGWDLRELAARYDRFLRDFAPLATWLRAAPSPADAFIVRTLLVHEYRKIHLRDPLLPPALEPSDWPGSAAYELCRTIYERVLPAAEAHLTRVAARLAGPLPAPDAALFRRFGGLRRA
ncbi:MAG: phenylacetic acid degradation operon negative regulatory protein PaaX [Proteobacteria bacterium]|nr:phenylacetic acid degradation operon negative regulatory protein PaaX [Pseudomonadota bacterium]